MELVPTKSVTSVDAANKPGRVNLYQNTLTLFVTLHRTANRGPN